MMDTIAWKARLHRRIALLGTIVQLARRLRLEMELAWLDIIVQLARPKKLALVRA